MHSDKVEYNVNKSINKITNETIRPYCTTSIFKINKIDIRLKSRVKISKTRLRQVYK